MSINLIGPDGAAIDLSSNNGGGGDNYGTGCGGRTVFNDGAATSITAGSAPFVGNFRPEEALSAFVGKSGSAANGTWTLQITDNSGGDTGNLVCWSLIIQSPTCADANCALPNLSYFGSSVQDGTGNGNFKLDPNECASLNVGIKNTGAGSASAISATLSTTTPGVTITQPYATFPDIGSSLNGTSLVPFGVTTAPNYACGTPIQMSLAITSAQGTFQSNFTLFSGTPAIKTFTSSDVPKAIPDGDYTGADSNVTVSGIAGSVSNAAVRFHISHTYDGDLSIGLIAPDSTGAFLVTQIGDKFDNFGTDCPADANDTILSDSGATSILDSAAPFVGTFRPQVPLAIYSGKNGSAANGTWKLHVTDPHPGNTGTIQCWSLTLTDNVCTPAPGVCSQIGEPNLLKWNTGSKTAMNWGGVGGATGYNLYRGASSDLPKLLNSSTDSCRRATTASPSTGSTLNEIPVPGNFFWYLVRAENAGGEGTAGNATSGPRILNSSGNCP